LFLVIYYSVNILEGLKRLARYILELKFSETPIYEFIINELEKYLQKEYNMNSTQVVFEWTSQRSNKTSQALAVDSQKKTELAP
jgi:hypothetical protein